MRGIDLPDASVLIQVSGTFGSRQEEAQRLGRVLRPAAGKTAHFYTIVAAGTREQHFAARRQRFLVNQGYTYEIVESPLPVKNYKSKLWLEVDDEPNRSVIYWQSDFDANGKSDDEATKAISDIFMAGLKSIKQKTMPPEGTAGGD